MEPHRWATKKEIQQTYAHVPFRPEEWRKGERLPKKAGGLVLGCEGRKDHVIAIVDTDDITPWLPPPAAQAKRPIFFIPISNTLWPTGMSFLCTDTKGDLFRNYAGIAKRSATAFKSRRAGSAQPTRSDGNNLLHLIPTSTWISTRLTPKIAGQGQGWRSMPRSSPRP